MPLIRDNPTSLYRQIARVLRQDIAEGRVEPSGRLPSEAEIGARFAVSRVTVRLALDQLDKDGMIERRKGKGTYVAGRQVRHELGPLRSFHQSLRMQGLDASMQIIDLALTPTPAALAALFGGAGECLLLERLHLVDGEPIALGRSLLPASLAGLTREAAEKTPTYAILTAQTGLEIARASAAIGAAAADAPLARILNTTEGAPLLVMERTSLFPDGSCAEHSTFHVRPERYRFVVGDVGAKVPPV